MSNIYNLEPPTKGKVVLHTTMGDLDIELWPKEAPKAVRNFVQLCMEGYYDDTIFHRVIRDYMIQGGDPSGTGDSGESVYGTLFKDEFHQRLKFNRRGLVACANQNEPNTNGSQFFVTLDKCEWLDKKNTIFGRVVGDTVFNLARMNEIDTDPETDRPYDPPKVLSTEVLWNPFEDIVLRVDPAAIKAAKEEEEARLKAEAARKAKAAAAKGKNLALLSFGDQAEEEEAVVAAAPRKIRAAHDVLQDERLVRAEDTPMEERITIEPRAKKARTAEQQAADDVATGAARAHTREVLAAKAAEASGRARVKKEEGGEGEEGRGRRRGDEEEEEAATKADGADFAARMRGRIADMRKRVGDVGEEREDGGGGGRHGEKADEEGSGRGRRERSASAERGADAGEEGDKHAGGRMGAGAIRQGRADELEDLKRSKKAYGKVQAAGLEVHDAELLKPWQVSREMYRQRKRVMGGREKDTMARLAAFQAKLQGSGSQQGGPSKDEEQPQGGQQPEGDDTKKGPGDKGYAGKVDDSLDHRAYMPAAWRVDDYLEGDFLDAKLEDLREHKLNFASASGRTDNMRRMEDVDDYVVFDPLLEAKKGKFSKAAQAEKKRASEWAGKSNA